MCAVYVADQNSVTMFYESGTYGTALTTGSRVSGLWIGLVTDHSPTEEENVTKIFYAGTTDRNLGQQINTQKDYEGTITYHPQDFRMLTFVLGSTADSGSPSPYLHTYSESNSDDSYAFSDAGFPSFTIKDTKTNASGDGAHQVRTYQGCKVDTWSMTIANTEPVVCEVNYIAQGLSIGSKTSQLVKIFDEDTTRPYIWSDVQFHQPSGTKFTAVNEIGFTVNNNLERRHYNNGSKVIQTLVPLNRDYEVTLTLDANETRGRTLYSQWQNGTIFNCMIEAVLSSGSETGFFVMSGCKITSFESPSPAEGINEYSVTITPTTCIIKSDDLIKNHNPY